MNNEKRFDALAWRLHRVGLRPDHLTFLQTPVYAGLVYSAYRAKLEPAFLLLFAGLQLVVVLLDGMDGILARRTGTVSRRGHLLDSLFDIVGIGVTLWAVNYLYPSLGQWAFLLLFVNFLVYVQNEIQGTKAITYTRGPVTIGLLLERFYPGVLLVGLLLPLALGLILMVTRVEWRKRLWNWYQFLTAGRRREYKAVPRRERAALGTVPAAAPPPEARDRKSVV